MGNVGYETGQRQEGLVGQASGRAQDAASAAQDKASELKDQGRSKLQEQLDQRSSDAGSQMRSVAGALRQSTTNLRNEGNASAASITEGIADRVERLGSYLEHKGGDEMMRDVEDFARRRPWMFAGVGLLAGLATARFVKASSEGRYQQSGRASAYRARTGGTYRGGYEPMPAYGTGGDLSGRRESWPARDVDPLADAPIARDPADPVDLP